jgi:hypothetical protein
LIDPAPPVVAQDALPDFIPQEPSELQRSIREPFRRAPPASVLHISVKAALRDHPAAAKIAIYAELKQMLTMRVWTPVHKTGVSSADRSYYKVEHVLQGEVSTLRNF